MSEIPAIPPMPTTVRLTTHGRYDVSTNENHKGVCETRFFNLSHPRYDESGIPQSVADAVKGVQWSTLVTDTAYIGWDCESVKTNNVSDAMTVHDRFVQIITDYLTGVLA